MLYLPSPSAKAWDSFSVTLGGKEYKLEYKYNPRDERWRLSIFLNDSPVITSVKIVENLTIVGATYLENFDHGIIACLSFLNDNLPCGRNNLGIGLPYTLVYFTNAEMSEALV